MLISINSCLRKISVAWFGAAVLAAIYHLLTDGEMLRTAAQGILYILQTDHIDQSWLQ